MQKTSRKPDAKTKKETKDEPKKPEEKLKKNVYSSRDFLQKSTTADIYAQKKKSAMQNLTKAPKKVPGVTNTSNTSPMKGYLSSTNSSISVISRKSETPKRAVTNVTVNSPIVKRRLNLNSEREKGATLRKNEHIDNKSSKEVGKLSRQVSNVSRTKEARKESKEVVKERQRTKTRTLDENEVKILTPEILDNNTGMINLTQKLVAQPKAFYVGFDENKPTKLQKDKPSDEEVSYEDDFESYESDFDSYHSEQTDTDGTSEKSEASDKDESIEKSETSALETSERNRDIASAEISFKEKDEEKMLDSGNFDLREQRSAKAKPMDFILEDSEDRKTSSLTDEGFQDMSSSAGSSLRTQQVDRPLFIDLNKSKQSKIKRKIHERLQQRAKDLLSMITLHEMSFSLFEMQPISYDLYMATFGRSNYTQTGVQTFDDGITEEIQTDEVSVTQKWTQHPIEFSKSYIYMTKDEKLRKYSKHTEDYLTKFTFMMKMSSDYQYDDKMNTDENYKTNPLRVYLEQKDGAGGDQMLPYESYKSKLKSNSYNSNKLGKFLKKYESRISQVLTSNAGEKDVFNLVKSNKIPFSKGYFSLSSKTELDEKLSFLKNTKISQVIFSETNANLILTVHENVTELGRKKNLICLWDLSVAKTEPKKFLSAIDDVVIGKFRGNSLGVFVAALNDGSIHLWDLSEEASWRNDDVCDIRNDTEFVEINDTKLTEIERDREWNLKNSHVGFDKGRLAMALQSSAYTSSAANMTTKDNVDSVVGLEMNADIGNIDAGRRVLGQVLTLQRVGILTLWSIVRDKLKSSNDIGKAYLSKLKLEKCQTIHLIDHIDVFSKHNINTENYSYFNLNSAKRRLSLKKKEKCITKPQISRPQSAMSKFDFDIDRPSSAASMRKKVLPIEINIPKNWETGIVCNDLKIIRIDNVDSYMVARNCGEVLCCRRCLGTVRVERFTVASDTSSVTNLEVSNKGLPYFLAATDAGTVNLCSLLDNRVLLTLDCRNTPSSHDTDKCVSDSKGRFISSVTSRRPSETIERPLVKMEIKSVHWSHVSPCSVHVLLQDSTVLLFELTHSDIYAKHVCQHAAVQCAASDSHLALLTPEGEVHVHRLLTNESQAKENLKIFEKYVALL